MKEVKELTHKNFRYLTKEEVKDPLYAIAEICRSEIGLYRYRRVIGKLIRMSSTVAPKKIGTMKVSNMSYYCQFIMRNIELLYVLKHRFDDWALAENSPYYTVEFGRSDAWIHDDTLYNGTSLYFKRLKKGEVKNIGIFLDSFFAFKSLRKWYKLMEDFHSTLFDDFRLSEHSDYQHDDAKIFKYLEKLAEASYLIYEIKAKEYIFKHHVKDFRLERYLEQQADADGADDSQEPDERGTELAADNDTTDGPLESQSIAEKHTDDEQR